MLSFGLMFGIGREDFDGRRFKGNTMVFAL